MSESVATATHTPGPWNHKGAGIEARAFDGSWKWLTPVVHGGNPAEATANRALMAAAPDLLAACKAMLSDRTRDDHTSRIASAAIAKAEGQS